MRESFWRDSRALKYWHQGMMMRGCDGGFSSSANNSLGFQLRNFILYLFHVYLAQVKANLAKWKINLASFKNFDMIGSSLNINLYEVLVLCNYYLQKCIPVVFHRNLFLSWINSNDYSAISSERLADSTPSNLNNPLRLILSMFWVISCKKKEKSSFVVRIFFFSERT